MTVTQLLKKLEAMKKAGHGRAKVCVDKSTLWDGNATFSICDVKATAFEWVNIVDGDGFFEFTKAGLERGRMCVVLRGCQ